MGPRKLITGLSAWKPNDFSDEAAWTHELTPEETADLLALGRGNVSAAFESQIYKASRGWKDLLLGGPGFIRLRGFPTDSLTTAELERAYLSLGRLLGTPVGQDRHDSLFTHIRDERVAHRAGIRRFQTNLKQEFHSDASDVVGLLCLKPAKFGGVSRIVSAHTVFNEMTKRAPQLVEVMYRPMPWSRHTEQLPGRMPYFEMAPFADHGGLPRVSLITWYIRQSQVHPETPRLTPDQLAALELVETITRDSALQLAMEFEAGDVQFLNNATVLHARDAYEDHAALDLRRHLLRLWLTVDQNHADFLLPNHLLKSG